MCTVLLPPGVNPIAVNKYININKYFKPTQGIAVDSPISSTLAEIYLQYFEELLVKHWMETGEITYYRRYVDGIIIIFDKNEVTEGSIISCMNNIHKHLEFRLTEEENKNKLSRSIHTQRQQQRPTRDLQKTPIDRQYYTLYIQTSIRTKTRNVQILHKQCYLHHSQNKQDSKNGTLSVP
jgi:hypothetical protein